MMHVRYFRLYTHYSTVICRLENGSIGHMPPNADRAIHPEILVCVADTGSTQSVWFANCAEERPISLGTEPWAADLFPMRRLRVAATDLCAFGHPYSGQLLIALPSTPGDREFYCRVSRWREPGDWEQFRLEEVPWASIACAARATQAAHLLQAVASGALITLMATERPAAESEAIARLAPQRDYEHLAAQVVEDPALASRVLAFAEPDPFALGLANLLATGPYAHGANVDRVNDERFAGLSQQSPDGTYASFAHKLTSTARRQRRPSRRLCVLGMARDEGPYLLEWIAYHRAVGAEHFFLYTNDNADGSDELLGALQDAGIVTWIENTGSIRDMQAKAYGHALTVEPDILQYEWVAVLDIDEFVALREGGFQTIPDFLAWQENQPVDVVALLWAVYWSNGQVRWSDDLSIRRFGRQNTGSALGKSLFRPGKFTFAYPHHPAGSDPAQPIIVRDGSSARMAYPRGELTSSDTTGAAYGEAWINHYFSRSAEEFVWKWSRNRVDGSPIRSFAEVPLTFMAEFMANHHSATMDLPDAMGARLPEVGAELGVLLRLPGVADAQRRIIDIRDPQARRTRDIVTGISREGLSEAHRSFLRLFE